MSQIKDLDTNVSETMLSIKVNPFLVYKNGKREHYGEETGTPEFYIVSDILYKHLGEDNILIFWDYTEFFYKIQVTGDKNIDYIKIIESINEPYSQFNDEYQDNEHLIFQVIYD